MVPAWTAPSLDALENARQGARRDNSNRACLCTMSGAEPCELDPLLPQHSHLLQADEELLLLEGIELYGLGNWPKVAGAHAAPGLLDCRLPHALLRAHSSPRGAQPGYKQGCRAQRRKPGWRVLHCASQPYSCCSCVRASASATPLLRLCKGLLNPCPLLCEWDMCLHGLHCAAEHVGKSLEEVQGHYLATFIDHPGFPLPRRDPSMAGVRRWGLVGWTGLCAALQTALRWKGPPYVGCPNPWECSLGVQRAARRFGHLSTCWRTRCQLRHW